MQEPSFEHHAVFHKFRCWEGVVPKGYHPNFLGVMTRTAFFKQFSTDLEGQYWKGSYPGLDDQYLEWIDLLEAVTHAENEFVMMELGAGWGPWTANAAAAVRQHSRLPCRLIAVEAEPTHFEYLKQHLQENGVDLNQCQLIQAAVADRDGRVGFYTGETSFGGPTDWYGQFIGGPTEVEAVSLDSLLRPLEKVDLIDLDVQGVELDVLQSAAGQVNQKVKRVHIGTHSEMIEIGLRSLFALLGWKKIWDYPCGTVQETPWGEISFEDGVQTWVNPSLKEALDSHQWRSSSG